MDIKVSPDNIERITAILGLPKEASQAKITSTVKSLIRKNTSQSHKMLNELQKELTSVINTTQRDVG